MPLERHRTPAGAIPSLADEVLPKDVRIAVLTTEGELRGRLQYQPGGRPHVQVEMRVAADRTFQTSVPLGWGGVQARLLEPLDEARARMDNAITNPEDVAAVQQDIAAAMQQRGADGG